jgi:GT2 family glycosyltransferase
MSQSNSNKSEPGPVLSIVIVNWNTRELLAACLESVLDEIRALHPQPVQTLVVDNASRDGSAQMVEESFPWVDLTKNQSNVGFARGNNQVMPHIRGRYVLLLNPDTEVRPGAFQKLISFMEAHPEAGGAGPRLLNPDDTLQPSCYPAPTLTRELWRLFHLDAIRHYGTYCMADWDLDKDRVVDTVQGACLILRREVLDQIGLFDEEYFIYSEEVDLCFRLRQAGWSLYWVPQAQVVHYGGQSTQQVAAEMFLKLYESKVIFFRKHYGKLGTSAYKLVLLAASLARLLISPLAWLEAPPRRQRHLALAGHYGRLLAKLPRM